jgi:Tfp pilus assembly protein FimT
MQTEPPKAEPPKRKRRWFQFSLWTLTIAVAIVSVGCAICLPMLREWQQRQQEQADFEELIKLIYPGP